MNNYSLITAFATAFIFIMTALGSALVYFFKKEVSSKLGAIFFGVASGIMLASSVWSLLIPAIEQSATWGRLSFLPASVGLLAGAAFLLILEKCKFFSHTEKEEGLKKNFKLFLSITLHNIPEGLAVGFAFGVAQTLGTLEAYLVALGLAVGVGLQNIPEGLAVALPLYAETGDKNKAFLYGTFSGLPEPIFAVIGYFLSAQLRLAQPWLLAFSAGAMIFVVAEELIPKAKEQNSTLGAVGVIFGFTAMMILDVALG